MDSTNTPSIKSKNKYAILSFVLSIISVILSPLFIFQMTGIFFGIEGLKSEKRRLSKASITISIFAILIGLFVLYISSLSFIGDPSEKVRLKADVSYAQEIQKSISCYLDETKDFTIKLSGIENPTVEDIITYLHSYSNGSLYSNYIMPRAKNYKGWEIIIYKNEGKAEVKPSKLGNSVVIK